MKRRRPVRPAGRYCYQCGSRVYRVQNAEGEQFDVTSYAGGGQRHCPRG